MSGEQCKGCAFYLNPDAWQRMKVFSEPKGRCRRYPPVYIGARGGTEWPEVAETDWCGEWKDAAAKRQAAA